MTDKRTLTQWVTAYDDLKAENARLRIALEVEQEACAQVADKYPEQEPRYRSVCRGIAEAIRARRPALPRREKTI